MAEGRDWPGATWSTRSTVLSSRIPKTQAFGTKADSKRIAHCIILATSRNGLGIVAFVASTLDTPYLQDAWSNSKKSSTKFRSIFRLLVEVSAQFKIFNTKSRHYRKPPLRRSKKRLAAWGKAHWQSEACKLVVYTASLRSQQARVSCFKCVNVNVWLFKCRMYQNSNGRELQLYRPRVYY